MIKLDAVNTVLLRVTVWLIWVAGLVGKKGPRWETRGGYILRWIGKMEPASRVSKWRLVIHNISVPAVVRDAVAQQAVDSLFRRSSRLSIKISPYIGEAY